MPENLFLDKSLLDYGESDQDSMLMLFPDLNHVIDKDKTNIPGRTSENGNIRGRLNICFVNVRQRILYSFRRSTSGNREVDDKQYGKPGVPAANFSRKRTVYKYR